MQLLDLLRRLSLAISAMLALALPATAGQQIIVRQDGKGTTKTIQAAIDKARGGDEIIVHPGTYREAIDLRGRAVHLHSLSGAKVTIIDATGLRKSTVSCTSFEGPATVLEGFTITGGSGTPSQTKPVNVYGGGLYARFSNPTLLRCTFRANTADLGGGMLTFQGRRTKIIDCTFEKNSARLGGGLFNNGSDVWLDHPTFTGNHAAITGGGFHSTQGKATIQDGVFTGNRADLDGGGMYNAQNSASITKTVFTGNSARFDAGALYNWSSSSLVDECVFRRNSANRGGALINFSAQPVIADTLFESNSAGQGGAVFSWRSTSTLVGLTLSNNSASSYGGGLCLSAGKDDMRNCLLWANRAPKGAEIYLEPRSTMRVSASDIRGSGGSGAGWIRSNGTDGGGNLDVDPKFVAPKSGNYRLASGSPCIDAGASPLVPRVILVDLDGHPRFFDDPQTANTGKGAVPVDIGAYEFGSSSPWVDLGHSLAGINGRPTLRADAILTRGQPVVVSLARAAPRAATMLVVSSRRVDLPVFGGLLVPAPDVLIPVVTDAGGRWALRGSWPTNARTGTLVLLQAWITDAAGPEGFAASNGLSGTSR